MRQLYDEMCTWLSQHPISTGGCLAIVLTAIRIRLSEDRNSMTASTVLLEGLSCGLLSMAFSYTAINVCGLDSSIGVFCGATAGFIGVDRLKALFIRILDAYLSRSLQKSSGDVPAVYNTRKDDGDDEDEL